MLYRYEHRLELLLQHFSETALKHKLANKWKNLNAKRQTVENVQNGLVVNDPEWFREMIFLNNIPLKRRKHFQRKKAHNFIFDKSCDKISCKYGIYGNLILNNKQKRWWNSRGLWKIDLIKSYTNTRFNYIFNWTH